MNEPGWQTVVEAHTVSVVSVSLADSYCPCRHCVALVQSRLEVAVGLALSYCVDEHTWAARHGLPSSCVENMFTPEHASQSRSLVDEPASSWPWPAGQVDHVVHSEAPATLENWPKRHGVHLRSLAAVGAAVWYVPGGHAGLTAVQALRLTEGENSVTPLHGEHSTSVVADPACEAPLPAAQTFHATHLLLP
jgi:hypothetical protein